MQDQCQQTFLHNLAYLRRHYGLTQKQMASKLGIGPGSIHKIEQGIWPPNLGVSTLILTAIHFGVRSSVLLSCAWTRKARPLPA